MTDTDYSDERAAQGLPPEPSDEQMAELARLLAASAPEVA